jgi:hypothetical protein
VDFWHQWQWGPIVTLPEWSQCTSYLYQVSCCVSSDPWKQYSTGNLSALFYGIMWVNYHEVMMHVLSGLDRRNEKIRPFHCTELSRLLCYCCSYLLGIMEMGVTFYLVAWTDLFVSSPLFRCNSWTPSFIQEGCTVVISVLQILGEDYWRLSRLQCAQIVVLIYLHFVG